MIKINYFQWYHMELAILIITLGVNILHARFISKIKKQISEYRKNIMSNYKKVSMNFLSFTIQNPVKFP